jgi:hypothetical protein
MEARINEASLDDEEIEDDRLRPIFTCRRPALPPEGQVALTLREICGLTTEEIARASLVTPVPSAPVLPTVVISIQTLAATYITFVSITNWPCGDKLSYRHRPSLPLVLSLDLTEIALSEIPIQSKGFAGLIIGSQIAPWASRRQLLPWDFFLLARDSPKISGSATELPISAMERQVRMLLRRGSYRAS